MTLTWMTLNRRCFAPEDGSGTPPAPAEGEPPVDAAAPAPVGSLIGEEEGEETPPEGSPPEPSPFEAIVEPDAFKEALGPDFEITDEESFKTFIETINSAGSREELAKNLLDVYSQALQTTAKAAEDAFEETQKQWQEAVKADPTYGGAKLEQSLAVAKSVAKEYGSKEFLQLLSLTGAGNNLAMVDFLNKVSAALPKEAEPVAGNPAPQQRSLAERIFPTANGA